MPSNAIVIINGQPTQDYLPRLLKKQGFSVVYLLTSDFLSHAKNVIEESIDDDSIIKAHGDNSEVVQQLKGFLQRKEAILALAIAMQSTDIALVDTLNEALGKSSNGEAFRHLHQYKAIALQQINQALNNSLITQMVTIDTFNESISQLSLPCRVDVMAQQQVVATYKIAQLSDVSPVQQKLNTYTDVEKEVLVQPGYDTRYCLQVAVINHQAHCVAVWREKYAVKGIEVVEDVRELINPQEAALLFKAALADLCQPLTQALHLTNGIAEINVIAHQEHWAVVDYQCVLPNNHQLEVMERLFGYNVLTTYLMYSSMIAPLQTKREFKPVLAVNLWNNTQTELLKLSSLPTYYRYAASASVINLPEKILQDKQKGVLYLTHKNKSLVLASYASIRNTERLLANPQFASHSATHIVNFYREAALNTRTDYTLSQQQETTTVQEEQEALQLLAHEAQHIPRFIKPLGNKASIQDIMRYYIDIYDLYILHGKAPGTKVIPVNTGNPAFLPFKPIVKALRESLQQELLTYARYSMQVPETSFVKKMTQYCQEENILASEQQLETYNVVIGHGSTNLYYLALKALIKNKGDIVLITRPTYGLFIDPIYTAGGDVGFIDIKDNKDWKVTPKSLEETIHYYNQRAFNHYILTIFIKDYKKFLHAQKIFELDEASIPLMPDIETLTDLNSFDTYIEALNAYIDAIAHPEVNKEDLKFTFPPRVRAFYHMNPHNPTGAAYTQEDLTALAKVIQAHPDIYVIDDMAHWGVLYGAIEPATFASLKTMFERTITLMSLSKAYCVPGLRAGVALGKKEIISEMQYRLLNSSSSATYPAMLALNAVISTPKEERDRYLHSNAQEYFYRRNLMEALINGIQKGILTFEQQVKTYQLIVENEYNPEKPLDKKFLALILAGMPLVRTLTDPKGCFFHLLDISLLIGAKIGETSLLTATDVRNALFSICNIDCVPGEISGNFFNYSLRLSFSLTPTQIYTACKKINLFIGNYIVKHNPALLLKSHAANDAPILLPEAIIDEAILNKALVRLYLNQAIQAVINKHQTLFTANYLQNKPRLQKLETRLAELSALSERLVDVLQAETVHGVIHTYIKQNEVWLRKYLPSFEQLQLSNEANLAPSSSTKQLLPKMVKF